jgi:hypothetical protein
MKRNLPPSHRRAASYSHAATTLPHLLLSCLSFLAVLVFEGLADCEVVRGADPKALFNGKDFSGWHGRPTVDPRKWAEVSDQDKEKWNQEIATHWRVDGDEIVNDGKGAYLTTNEEFGDFEFSFEYKIVPGCDSGIYLRGIPQVQIWDPDAENNRGNGNEKGSGGLWNNPPGWSGKDPLVRADKPVGEWNTMRIRLVGEHCWVWLNGQAVVVDARLHDFFAPGQPLVQRGPIQLQTHGAEIRFRNLSVTEYSPEYSNTILRTAEDAAMSEAGKSFTSLFNGQDLSGWAGAKANYTVTEGAIQCLKGKGGVLHTEKTYGDFIVRLDFLLPPAGNNGLAIRYPTTEELDKMEKNNLHGDAAYVGMTELQVLDDGHPNYASIDPRQAHGSAYGMAAAKRGYLRPAGQWNHQMVTVEGSKIRVELNGTRILDTDLSMITEYMANTPHPGKDRTSGHFGFAGHSDPVQFRNIEIIATGN